MKRRIEKNHTFISIQFKKEKKQKNTLIYDLTKTHNINNDKNGRKECLED